ncbi:anthranilate synthase component 1 [Corynebacterium pygosceleis]|uniref:anthranilate synthase component 1 n=1 Tax=Corynebacterium pygosceleis TaxID=2800406 RepID=UPI001907B6E6|nr:anthranilate synthase component 1 [Corynebacterium pygosceleis]MCL0120040.1 anthranilate synthase component 1 [Corynebacterium pygosceleis]
MPVATGSPLKKEPRGNADDSPAPDDKGRPFEVTDTDSTTGDATTSPPAIDATIHRISVRYHENASNLFAFLGGTSVDDAVLLESADISSKQGLTSVAILRGSVRVTCHGDGVCAEPLTESGMFHVKRLRETLADRLVGESASDGGEGKVSFRFPPGTEVDERRRLTQISTVEPLRRLQRDPGYSDRAGSLPFIAGGFAFDYIDTFEDLPEVAPGENTYPDYQFLVAEILLTIDHQSRTAELVGVSVGEEETERLGEELARLAEAIEAAEPDHADAYIPTAHHTDTLTITTDTDDATVREQVKQLQKNIEVGDIYQVVPARSFLAPCPDAFAAYRALRATNPSPYMFYVRGLAAGDSYELFGASPESNLKFTAGTRQVELYPIAGTRPRGLNPDGTINDELDIRAELELRTDAKEISEHTMLVDLARNDLARVAVPATRRVADLLQVDRYSRVMHLVSRVTAELDPELDPLDAYRACMNMGTLTGAPKLRAMELLRNVEGKRRGSYGGAVGYLKGNGDMDTCIVIRSAFVRDGRAVVQAGAGVVRDSKPQAEADESLHKAFAVLNAIALAADANLEVIR